VNKKGVREMAQVIRTIQKRGAKNREINKSIKDAMKVILEMREIAEFKRMEKFRLAKETKRLEELSKRQAA
jgi:hypothetical protein